MNYALQLGRTTYATKFISSFFRLALGIQSIKEGTLACNIIINNCIFNKAYKAGYKAYLRYKTFKALENRTEMSNGNVTKKQNG